MKKFFFLFLSLFVINQLNCMEKDLKLNQSENFQQVEPWAKLPPELKVLIFNAYFKPLLLELTKPITYKQLKNKAVRHKLPLVLTNKEFKELVYHIFNEKTILTLVKNISLTKEELNKNISGLSNYEVFSFADKLPLSFYHIGKALLDRKKFKRLNTEFKDSADSLGKELIDLIQNLSTAEDDAQNNRDLTPTYLLIDSLIAQGANLDIEDESEKNALILAIEKGHLAIANTLIFSR